MAHPRNSAALRPTPKTGAILIGLLMLAACGGSDTPTPDTVAPTSTTSTSSPTSTTEPPAPTTTAPVELEQLALWPAPSVVFTSPKAAAEDFIVQVLGVPPEIGEFMSGDSRSGEILVYSPGNPPSPRGLLLLRQLGPSNGWFIIGTINDLALITSPESGTSVTAGPLTIEGLAEGFEATVIVEAFIAGRSEPILDREVTFAGNFGTPGPFQVTLDISAANPGDTVLILIRGGVGLETDPGEFGAIAVLIAE
ncbi:MAG: hypothetical protein RL119_1119 [Actinomycetota bacterium]